MARPLPQTGTTSATHRRTVAGYSAAAATSSRCPVGTGDQPTQPEHATSDGRASSASAATRSGAAPSSAAHSAAQPRRHRRCGSTATALPDRGAPPATTLPMAVRVPVPVPVPADGRGDTGGGPCRWAMTQQSGASSSSSSQPRTRPSSIQPAERERASPALPGTDEATKP